MDSKENPGQGIGMLPLLHHREPTLPLIYPHCSVVLSGGSLEITVTFHRALLCLSVPRDIHHSLSPLVYVIRCAHRQIRAQVTTDSKALKGGIPWPQGRGPSTPLHTHTRAHTRT